MKKVHIRTYGCQMNARESDALAALLVRRGYVLSSEKDADILLLNTCSVRAVAEDKAIGKAGHLLKKQGKIVGIFGCLAQNRPKEVLRALPNVAFIVGTQRWHTIPDRLEIILERGQHDERIDVTEDSSVLSAVDGHTNPQVSAFVSIQQGCDMHCSYCIVPKVRGEERSRPIEAIVEEVRMLASRGVKEITLLGQVVTNYGRKMMMPVNGKSPFVQLLAKIHDVNGIERIRFVSPHPNGFREDLIEAYTMPKICPAAHLPLQSGSDKILHAMNRPYTAAKYMKIVDALRAKVPGICLSTDVIVGFPGETEEDFEQTLSIFKKCEFGMAYIFKYSPRMGTVSYDFFDNVDEASKEHRNQLLIDVLSESSLKFNQNLVGTEQSVLVEGLAKRGGVYYGKTPTLRKVLFHGAQDKVGQIVNLRIKKATVCTLEA